MMDKEALRKKFSASPDKYYRVDLFREEGFLRKKCMKCKGYFWTLDPERTICPNPPCEEYGFIGDPQTKKRLDYIETWKVIERFFRKEGHESIPSYPVVCRWFPGLYFTVASIVAFQRSVFGKTVFEMPANPLIIPQSCLRFPDIPNVGVTGRHMTNFIMVGQHSICEKNQGYWKDRCVELDFKLLKEAFGIKPEMINFLEEVWVGPAAFGYSLEYFVKGLELGNAVFTEFVGTPQNYKRMEQKVIDMGAGLERFTWLSQGTPTAYDAVYGPVIEKLKKHVDYNEDLFRKYAMLAGNLDIEDVRDMKAAKETIARKLGLEPSELIGMTGPLEALYAIADHSKTLLHAITDGALPSNVGGGYNLRVVLRRALGFIDEFNFDFNLIDICRWHAKYLKPLNPKLTENLRNVEEILKVEEERFEKTRKRSGSIIQSMIKRGERLDNRKLIELYESHGISPELIKEEAEKSGKGVEIPANFYQQISEKHIQEKGEETPLDMETSDLPKTELLYYAKEKERRFSAEVLKVINGKCVVLDRTLFYPESGGQGGDTGLLQTDDGKQFRVYDVQKMSGVILHYVDRPLFKKGQKVLGEIDWGRREQLTIHHTSIHIINAAARKVLGNHVWQAGSGKTPEKAHLDITHYESLTQEQTGRIEEEANSIVKRGISIEKKFMKRAEAEKQFGMRIYQGGAVPGKELRIVNTPRVDVEACGGTHLDSTQDAGIIVITGSERIQDGVVRITIKAGRAAEKYLENNTALAKRLMKILNEIPIFRLSEKFLVKLESPLLIFKELQRASSVFNVSIEQLEDTVKRFGTEIVENQRELNLLEGKLGMPLTDIDYYTMNKEIDNLEMICDYIFCVWKDQRKHIEKLRKGYARAEAKGLSGKAVRNRIFEIVHGSRKELIEISNELLNLNPKLMVILANESGELVGMSRTNDMDVVIKDIAQRAGGSGGGNRELAQGRAELSKLLKIIELEKLKNLEDKAECAEKKEKEPSEEENKEKEETREEKKE